MPTEYHLRTNCCDEKPAKDAVVNYPPSVRVECPNCGWLTDLNVAEKIVVDPRGDVL